MFASMISSSSHFKDCLSNSLFQISLVDPKSLIPHAPRPRVPKSISAECPSTNKIDGAHLVSLCQP